jgi:hypothetical protein
VLDSYSDPHDLKSRIRLQIDRIRNTACVFISFSFKTEKVTSFLHGNHVNTVALQYYHHSSWLGNGHSWYRIWKVKRGAWRERRSQCPRGGCISVCKGNNIDFYSRLWQNIQHRSRFFSVRLQLAKTLGSVSSCDNISVYVRGTEKNVFHGCKKFLMFSKNNTTVLPYQYGTSAQGHFYYSCYCFLFIIFYSTPM